MIDSIKLAIPIKSCDTTSLKNLRTSTDDDGVVMRQFGKLHNLKVTLTPNSYTEEKVTVEGSIRKYFYGEAALDDLTEEDFWKAIDRLSTQLNIPLPTLYMAKIYKIECGLNMQMERPISDYIQAINRKSKLKKKQAVGDETVKFMGANKSVIFYNKIKDIKKRSPGIPITYKGMPPTSHNWLRYELKVTKISALGKQLNNLVYLGQLRTKMNPLLDRVIMEFDDVQFSMLEEINMSTPIHHVTNVLASALLIGVKGDGPAIQILDNLFAQKVISRAQFRTAKAKVTETASSLSSSEVGFKDTLLKEITERVYKAYSWYRAEKTDTSIPAGSSTISEHPLDFDKFTFFDSETLEKVPTVSAHISTSDSKHTDIG